MKRVLTYGTFDLLHYGHIRLLKRAKELGDYLVVAISTDEFNTIKNKKAYYNYETRKKMIEAIRYVDLVIPENTWEQKAKDVIDYNIDIIVMGSDWANSEKFEYLKNLCDVVYLDRTKGISTTKIKEDLGLQEPINGIEQISESSSKKVKVKEKEKLDYETINKEQIVNLILEFDERKAKEVSFAHYCDKLECDIQSKLYNVASFRPRWL